MASPITKLVEATASSLGVVTFAFPDSPSITETWTGTLSIAGVPQAAQFSVTVASIPWGNWLGTASSGPVQQLSRLPMVVTGTGLLPGQVVTCYFIGVTEAVADAYPVSPSVVPPQPSLSNIGATLNRFDTILAGATLTYPVIDCTNWAAIQIAFQSQNFPTDLQISWFLDSAASLQIAAEKVTVDTNLFANLTLPNQGPFVQISATAATAGNVGASMVATPTNRPRPPWNPFVAGGPLLFAVASLNPGASRTFVGRYAFAGPVFSHTLTASASYLFQLEGLELNAVSGGSGFNADAFDLLHYDTSIGATGPNHDQILYIPGLRLLATIKNTGGSLATFVWTMVADTFR